MPVVQCPECKDEVSLPEGLAPDAKLQCPLCSSEYAMQAIIDKLPPLMIVVDPGSTPTPTPTSASASASNSREGSRSGGAGFSFSPSDESASAPASTPAFVPSDGGEKPGSSVRSPGPRKDGGGMGIEIVKVVLGGLAAFPLIQMLVWWGFGRDPMDLAPMVRDIPGVGIVVPKEFRNEEGSGLEEGDKGMLVEEDEEDKKSSTKSNRKSREVNTGD